MSGGRTNRFSSGSPVQFNSSHLVVDGCPESQAFLAKELLEIEIDKLKKHNDSLGVYWLANASEQGHTEATEMLKNCLKTGKGITKRNIEDVMACLNNMTQKEKISARSTSLSQGIKTRSMSLICQIDIPLGCDNKTVISLLNYELDIVSNWLSINGLVLNVPKTKCMAVCKQTIYCDIINKFHIKIGCEQIQWVEEYKYLGVIIDHKLNFNRQACYVIGKIGKKLGFIGRLSFLPMNTKKMLYNTLVLPHFNYCNTILYYANREWLVRLQRLQNRGMRIILRCSKFTHTADLLKRLDWLNVQEYLFMQVMIFIWKAVNGGVPNFLVEENMKKVSEVHSYNTRHCENFYVNKAKKTNRYKVVMKSGLVEFNKLPLCIKECKKIEKFKKLLKSFLKTK